MDVLAPAPESPLGATPFAVAGQTVVSWGSGALQTGTSQLSGALGVGVAPANGYGVYIGGPSASAAFEIGLFSGVTYDASATSWCAGVYSKVSTAAASYTQGTAFIFAAGSPTIGAGSAITSLYGLYVYNLGAAGVANAYGIYIANQTGASSTNLGIRSDAQVWINNTLSIGSQMPVSQVGLNLVVNLSGIGVSGVGADQVCQKIVGVFSSAAGSGMGLYFQPTSGSSNTFSSIWAFYIDGSNLGTSPCTNYYGLYVRNQARAQTTNSYGVYIENQSGSPTTNMGLYNAGHSQLMGYVGVNVNPVGITGNPQMVISGVNGTGAPYVPNLQLSNTANATGAAAFLRFTTGSGYSTGIACIQNQWWHAFTDSTGAPAWGYDGSRVRFAGDTGWTTPAFLNGYTAYSAPYATGYRKFVDGRVQLRGLVNAPASAGTSAFQLPAGYRPAANMTYLFTQITSFGIIRVDVQSDGNVVCGIEVRVGTWANGGWISLDGCIFLAEQ